MRRIFVVLFATLVFVVLTHVSSNSYSLDQPTSKTTTRPADTVETRFQCPAGFARVDAEAGSFGAYLRSLPLQPEGTPVVLFDGQLKPNQKAHAAVIAVDVGQKDLQQCADAVIRLRAEYLWAAERRNEIAFHFTSGDLARWSEWSEGQRPIVSGNRVNWVKRAGRDQSRASFSQYLETVFRYAGTRSLEKELRATKETDMVEIGDVFIRGGSPGHAVIIVDAAEDAASGRRVFMLAQSYMPAQSIHILKNDNEPKLSPWYRADFGETLQTPEWTFSAHERRRFP